MHHAFETDVLGPGNEPRPDEKAEFGYATLAGFRRRGGEDFFFMRIFPA